MHGAGNDYIYVNTLLYKVADPSAAAVAWSRPHTGIGSDGLVLIGESPVPEADFSMHIYNADGSEAMMCGNASRCIGKYLYEKGLTDKTEIRLLTLSGVKTLLLQVSGGRVESVTVDMLEPAVGNDGEEVTLVIDQPATKGNPRQASLFTGLDVSMGNPHFVIFTDDVMAVELDRVGPLLERHPHFPNRANIEFAQPMPDGTIRTRVWERGSGITMACGTGACATAVAAAVTGRATRQSRIAMDGGMLTIDWRKSDSHVMMTGPAEFVFEGEIEAL